LTALAAHLTTPQIAGIRFRGGASNHALAVQQ